MKRRFYFLSLLLCLCLLVPAFSVSASAINIDGYDVFTNVYDPQLGDYKEFENTLSLNVSEKSVRIIFDIHLPEVIEKNTVFDLEVDFNIGQYLTISEWNGGGTMYDSNWNQLEGSLPGIVRNGKLKESQIIAQGDVKFIRYVFDIYNPTWHIVNVNTGRVSDLTGTSWVFGNQLKSFPDASFSYSANFDFVVDCDDPLRGNNNKPFFFDLNTSGWSYFLSGRGVFDISGSTSITTFYTGYKSIPKINSNFNNFKSFTVTFTSGNDLCNINLIDWLYQNADLISGGSDTQAVQYTFDFAVTSVTLTQEKEDTGIFAGIFGWVKKIFNAILDIPNAIGKKLTEFGNWLIDKIKGLFIPSEQSVLDLKDKFESLFADRFGAAYQSVEIVDQFGQAMGISTYAEADPTVTFPSVTVNLAGTPFTFGGWEVDLIPKGFEALLTPLRLIVDIVCTIAVVNTFRRRMEGILG